MKKKIINFLLGKKMLFVLLTMCGMFVVYFFLLTLFQHIGIITGMFAEFGWTMLAISIYYCREKLSFIKSDMILTRMDILDRNNEIIKKSIFELNLAYQYNERLANNVSIYSRLVKSVGTPIANALTSFAVSTNPDDTLFLIRVNHSESKWYFNVVGSAIHVDMAKAILDMAKNKADAVARPDGQIVMFDNISN
jgi:hypothetical protein